MSWTDDLSARLKDWGKAAFAHELETGFSRARIFDGKWAQIDFDVLGQFSGEDLKVLGKILPVLDDEFRKTLAERELQLVDAFHTAGQQLVLKRREAIMEQTVLTLRKPAREDVAKMPVPLILPHRQPHCEYRSRIQLTRYLNLPAVRLHDRL